MRKAAVIPAALLLGLVFFQGPAAAQEPAEIHVAHILERFNGTPDLQGLLPTALAEARIAAQHAELGARDPEDLAAMKLHAEHVGHAIDPRSLRNGPGLGHGLMSAVEDVARHAELAARSQGATESIITHSEHVAASAKSVLERAEKALALTEAIVHHIDTAADAAALFNELRALTDQFLSAEEQDGDEGGLLYTERHANLMASGTR